MVIQSQGDRQIWPTGCLIGSTRSRRIIGCGLGTTELPEIQVRFDTEASEAVLKGLERLRFVWLRGFVDSGDRHQETS